MFGRVPFPTHKSIPTIVDKQIQISYYGFKMFSQTAEYALRAIVVLAYDPAKPYTAQDIAAQSMVPQDYLMKVLQALAKEGFVTAQRGRGGGFVLRRQPSEISVLDVINAVEIGRAS